MSDISLCGGDSTCEENEVEEGCLEEYLEIAENYFSLRCGLQDVEPSQLWILAVEQHREHRFGSCGDLENGSLDNYLSFLSESSSCETSTADCADTLHVYAENYYTLRTAVPNADPAYIWKISVSQERDALNEIVDSMLATDEYPKIPGYTTPSGDRRTEMHHNQLLRAKAILPDADPEFLKEKLETTGCGEEYDKFLSDCMELRNYRTIHEANAIRRRNNIRNMYTNQFDVIHFLNLIPDPDSYFMKSSREHSPKYKEDCVRYLNTKFQLASDAAMELLQQNNFNISICVFSLPREMLSSSTFVATDECIPFLQEMAYIENNAIISEILAERKSAKSAAYEDAVAFGLLLSCECCFTGEAPENIKTCSEGHVFCEECLKRWAEVKISSGSTSVPCMEECAGDFHLQVLQELLDPVAINHYLHRKQEYEITEAAVEGLEYCPFCHFAYIPRTTDKVFSCLNVECGEQSCRSCKKPNHAPQPCESTPEEIKLRTFIEDRMTDALVRTCRCGRRFVKTGGCNTMTCLCGTVSCYVCQQVLSASNRHTVHGKCAASDEYRLHTLPVHTAGLQAKADAEIMFPGVELKHDPTL